MYGGDDRKEEDKGIKISSHGSDSFSLRNLQREEVENLQGMVYNHFWVTVTDGRLEVVRRREELPGPAEDEEMLPFWRRATPGTQQVQLFEVDIPKHSFPSIIIQSLCGYAYTPENYKYTAELLESYGFVCLRSRRGEDSKYWEMWFLCGLWSAKGGLKEFLEMASSESDKKKLEATIKFLCKNVQFGTLDVSWQRAAMTIPD